MDKRMENATLDALARLKARYRTYSRAAEELGITRQALQDWRINGRVSHRKAAHVAQITGIPIEDLRPDLFVGDHSSTAA